jgi:hypothetical protein
MAILVNDNAGALALTAERLHGLPFGIDEGLDADDRGDQLFDRGGAGWNNAECNATESEQEREGLADRAHGFSRDSVR